MLFDEAHTNTKQGDIGEARAIYEYTKMGYVVSRTIFDSAMYDLLIDDGKSIKKVQVKTSSQQFENGSFQVQLSRTGGNRKINTIRHREDSDYDILFVLTDDNRCFSIPTSELKARAQLKVGGRSYNEFEI